MQNGDMLLIAAENEGVALRDEIGKTELGSHGADSPSKTAPLESKTSSNLSQSPYSMLNDSLTRR